MRVWEMDWPDIRLVTDVPSAAAERLLERLERVKRENPVVKE